MVRCARVIGIALIFVGLSQLEQAYALDSTDVLPAQIRSPSLRIGNIQGVDSKFNAQGELQTLNDLNSREFNIKTLTTIEPQIQQLVDALNAFDPMARNGDKLSLGYLRVQVKPQIQYIAPIHAWGITDKWTFGFGLPVVRYKNEIQLYQQGSNLDQFRRQYGGVNPELDQAFDRLNVNLPDAVRAELIRKGYKDLNNKDETLWGDLELANMYQFYNDGRLTFLHRLGLTLPTGKKADPADFLSLDVFGETAVDNQIIGSWRFAKDFSLRGRVGYHYPIPDKVAKRVPKSENDTLPGPESEEMSARQLGPSKMLASSINWDVNRVLSLGGGYEYREKDQDRYSGNVQSGRYDLLERGSEQKTQRMRWDITYSTVKKYMAKESAIPSLWTVEITDVFAGINVSRQTMTEMQMVLFY